MPSVILDACGTLNLYASGQFLAILSALGNAWYLPSAVERESQTHRQPDPADHEKLIVVPLELESAFASGALLRCDCATAAELELYVALAARIGDDGESMGLAIAKCRGWSVLTDDKKARRIAGELAVSVLSTPEVMRQWNEIAKPGPAALSSALQAIERFANFRPSRSAEHFGWWNAAIAAGE